MFFLVPQDFFLSIQVYIEQVELPVKTILWSIYIRLFSLNLLTWVEQVLKGIEFISDS